MRAMLPSGCHLQERKNLRLHDLQASGEGEEDVNPFKWYRNWRIRRTEERIAYLEKYCDFFKTEGGIPYRIAVYHGLEDKKAKIAQLRKKLYYLMEF
jgi:hypothetical protein